jgi:RND superfamily putative drug exporter
MEGTVRRRRRPVTAGRLARAHAWVVVRARLLIIPAWIAAAIAATLYLPQVAGTNGVTVGDLVPDDAPAVRAEIQSYRRFSLPVLSRIAVVQRDPEGLSPDAQARVFTRALRIDTGNEPDSGIAGALPVTNTLRLVPGSTEESTTAITFLFFPPEMDVQTQTEAAREFARREVGKPDDALVGVTGPIAARAEQSNLILRFLPLVDVVTVALIVIILGSYFRSVGAPLVTLAAAGIAYLVSIRLVAWTGQQLGLVLPKDLEPVIVVLLLGIVTDYSIFFLSGFRFRLESNEPRLLAARRATADFVPIIFTAGLIVAAGTASLLVASLGFLQAFAPGLAITVLISLLVSITFVPAVMALFGRSLFWPRSRTWARAQAEAELEGRTPGAGPAAAQVEERPPGWRARFARAMSRPRWAALIALLGVAVLLLAASGLRRTALGFPLIESLPEDSETLQAARAAQEGFVPGVLSPTLVELEGRGLNRRGPELEGLRDAIAGQPGVGGVLGPSPELAELSEGLMVTRDGTAARYVVFLSVDPLGAAGIEALHGLQERMPRLVASAGLGDAEVAYAGDTALSDESVSQMFDDLRVVAVAALVIDFLLLVVFLRGLVAPLLLLATSILALAAALGLTTYVFQGALGRGELTYYVPFAAAVLLLSLGSDYNVFVAGRIRDEARVRPLREAIGIAAPRAGRTISIAGVVLAASFAALAVVPLVQFREFAFTMAVGIVLDTFLVRSLLVPALIALFGQVTWWPGRGPRPLEERVEPSRVPA